MKSMNLNEFKNKVRNLVSAGLAEKSLTILEKVVDNKYSSFELPDSYTNSFYLIKRKYSDVNKKELDGTLSYQDLFILNAQISNSILSLTDEIVSKSNEVKQTSDSNSNENELNIVEFKLKGSFEEFSSQDREKFISAITTILDIPNTDIRIVNQYKGSIILVLELKNRDYLKVHDLFRFGLLKFLGVESIEKVNNNLSEKGSYVKVLGLIEQQLNNTFNFLLSQNKENLFEKILTDFTIEKLKFLFEFNKDAFEVNGRENILQQSVILWRKLIEYQMLMSQGSDLVVRMTLNCDNSIWNPKENEEIREILLLQKRFIQKNGVLILVFNCKANNEDNNEIVKFYQEELTIPVYFAKNQTHDLPFDFLYLHNQKMVVEWHKDSIDTKLCRMRITRDKQTLESILRMWTKLFEITYKQLDHKQHEIFRKYKL